MGEQFVDVLGDLNVRTTIRTKRGRLAAVIRYTVDGSEHERCRMLPTTSRREARRLLHVFVREFEDEMSGVGPKKAESTRRDAVGEETAPCCVDYGLKLVERKLATGSIERSSAGHYRRDLESWRPYVGDKSIGELTEDDVVRALSGMLSSGRVTSTVDKRYTAMQMACRHAVRAGDAKSNPFQWVQRPKRSRPAKNYLPKAERQRLKLMLASCRPSRGKVATALALYGALREGEVTGLQWSSVEWGRCIWVRRAIGEEDGNEYPKDVKTDEWRDVPMCSALEDALREWRGEQEREFAAKGTRVSPNDYVLGRPDGTWCPRSLVYRWWVGYRDALGITGVLGKPPTFHDLRRTWISAMIAGGADVLTVARIAGHRDPTMTLNEYGVADPQAKEAARELIAGTI